MSIKFPQIISYNGMTIKLYHWMDYPKGDAARNVIAYNESGNEIWTIEPLGGTPGTDYYTHIETKDGKLFASNFQLVMTAGSILAMEKFYKVFSLSRQQQVPNKTLNTCATAWHTGTVMWRRSRFSPPRYCPLA